LIIILVFEKNAIFSAKNWHKLKKIVIITSTTGLIFLNNDIDRKLVNFKNFYRRLPFVVSDSLVIINFRHFYYLSLSLSLSLSLRIRPPSTHSGQSVSKCGLSQLKAIWDGLHITTFWYVGNWTIRQFFING
jgi:hypothetical protein